MYRRHGSTYQFLKLAEEAGRLGFWSLDFATGEMSISPGFAQIVGQAQNENTQGIFDNLIHPADRSAQADLRVLLYSGCSFERTYRIIRQDQMMRWIKVRANIVLGSGDAPVRAEGILFDVSESEEARRLIEKSETRYRGLLRSIGAFVWIASPDGQFYPSSEWETLTGQAHQETQHLGYHKVVHPQDREPALHAWQAARLEDRPFEHNIRIFCKDGLVRRFRNHGAPVYNRDGAIIEWIGVLLPLETGRSAARIEVDDNIEIDGLLVRGARALLGWSIVKLAEVAQVSVSSVRRLEEQRTLEASRTKIGRMILSALMHAGIAFERDDDGIVKMSLKRPTPPQDLGS